MEQKHIQVEASGCDALKGIAAIIVPEIALGEPGYISFWAVNNSGSSKHEFFALAQMAYYQYQDDELEIRKLQAPLVITREGGREELASGMAILRQESGAIEVCIHDHLNAKKMLEVTNRYCTRWVRLDI